MTHVKDELLLRGQILQTFLKDGMIMLRIYFSLNRIGTLHVRALIPVSEQMIPILFIIICSFQVIVCAIPAECINIVVRIGEFIRSAFIFDETDEYILRKVFGQMRIMEHFDKKPVALVPVLFE